MVKAAADALAAPLERSGGEDPYALQRELQATMQSLVGIYREASDLEEAIRRLADLRDRWTRVRATGGRAYNPGWNLVFELGNALTVAEAVARSALLRTESRGAHSRLDYPGTDDSTWGTVNSIVSRSADGSMTVGIMPHPALTDEQRGLLGASDH
jgi:succinate dehydrogenase / fumarate reductase flavoprotein subunit